MTQLRAQQYIIYNTYLQVDYKDVIKGAGRVRRVLAILSML